MRADSTLRFKAWGESRYTFGSTPTTYRYTGQREQSQLSIYYYGARWYDPALSRFLSPDTIIPGAGDSQAWDRFAYALNSPLKYIDPDGHAPRCPGDLGCQSISYDPSESVDEARGIVRDWFFETGSEKQYFDQTHSLTQDVIHDQGMANFRKAWAESGYKVPFEYHHERDQGGGVIKGVLAYFQEHFVELGASMIGLGSKKPEGKIDPVGGTIGSLDKIYVRAYGEDRVWIGVMNDTGWKSGSRVPGTYYSLLNDRDRRKWGPGGTVTQVFYWTEKKPHKNLKKQR